METNAPNTKEYIRKQLKEIVNNISSTNARLLEAKQELIKSEKDVSYESSMLKEQTKDYNNFLQMYMELGGKEYEI